MEERAKSANEKAETMKVKVERLQIELTEVENMFEEVDVLIEEEGKRRPTQKRKQGNWSDRIGWPWQRKS